MTISMALFSENDQGKIVGLATDGDIRRAMIDGALVDDPVSRCANTEFLSENVGVSREN